jgi:acyl-CoA thioesterase
MGWKQYPTKLEKGDWINNAAVLCYMSDQGILGTIRQPYEDKYTITQSMSLDHTIHFHQSHLLDVTDWVLFHR